MNDIVWSCYVDREKGITSDADKLSHINWNTAIDSVRYQKHIAEILCWIETYD